jgi:hypothetical protein
MTQLRALNQWAISYQVTGHSPILSSILSLPQQRTRDRRRGLNLNRIDV